MVHLVHQVACEIVEAALPNQRIGRCAKVLRGATLKYVLNYLDFPTVSFLQERVFRHCTGFGPDRLKEICGKSEIRVLS